MDLDRIREILQIVSESGVAEVEVEDESFRMVVRQHVQQEVVTYQQPAAVSPALPPVPSAPAAAPQQPEEPQRGANEIEVRAPIVGTFYSAPSPDSPPFVSVGDRIAKGDVLCIIEAMKLMNEIESEVDGVVKQILTDNAQPVQYDETLFIVEAS